MMNKRLLLLLAFIVAAWAASSPVVWSVNPAFNSSKAVIYVVSSTLMSTSTTKKGSVTVSYGVVYSTLPKLCYSIFNVSSTASTIFSIDVVLIGATTTTSTVNYTIGNMTTVSSIKIYILSFANSSATSFLSVNHGISLASLTGTICH